MKTGKIILGAAIIYGIYYLLKKSKDNKQPVVTPKPVTGTLVTPPLNTTISETIVTPIEQVSDLANQITSSTCNRVNVRYIAGKTHYI